MTEVPEAEAASFRILGVRPGASAEEVRGAFRRQAKLHHPDRNPGNSEAEERFKEILAAYRIALRSIEGRDRAAAAAAESRRARPHHEPSGAYVRRSRSVSGAAIGRILLFILFTAGPILFLILIIWSNSTTEWITNIRIEELPGPFDPPSAPEPHAPRE